MDASSTAPSPQPQQAASAPRQLFDLQTAEGLNESERMLTNLCQKSFLRLWAQNNVYTDEGFKNGRGSTKELCDALVVFGNDVIIFSDKHITFQTEKPLEIAWPRWYRRAVVDSIRQLHGARNWLLRFPGRAFLDSACLRKLPVAVPAAEKVKFHLVAVTRGSREASLAARGGVGIGSFLVNTTIAGDNHLKTPFAIGHPDPKNGFVHVFDEVTVELLLSELDTAADFIAYLNERQRMLGRQGTTVLARGEEDLLAFYLQTMDDSGSKHLLGPKEETPDLTIFDDELFERLVTEPAYLRKKAADKVSYAWDLLVERFIELGDPTLNEDFLDQAPSETEQGLRLLAAENRFRRRQLAETYLGALQRVGPGERLGRVVYSGVADETVFVFVVAPMREGESYQEYRRHRLGVLHAYVRTAKLKAPLGTVFVGVAFDNPHKKDRGGSEDLLVWTQPTWTTEDLHELESLRVELGLFGPNMEVQHWKGTEFPQDPAAILDTRSSTVLQARRKKGQTDKRRKQMKQRSQRKNRN